MGVKARLPYRMERTVSMPYPPTILDAAEELLRFFDKYPVLKIAGEGHCR